MRLRVSLDKGLVVVIPKTMNQYQANKFIPKFINEQQNWITKTFHKLQKQREKIPCIEQCSLPEKIELTAVQEIFSINYIQPSNKKLLIQQTADAQLTISGNTNNKKKLF